MIGTLPILSTSTLVEHGGVVGKMDNTAFPTGLRLRVDRRTYCNGKILS